MAGTYNPWLVSLSLLVAILASYTGLDVAGRISASSGRRARWWLAGGSFAMGVGVWSMHFVGMLAFQLPTQMGYDPWITLASLAIAIASSAFALRVVETDQLTATRLVCGAVLMGAGIASMHYTGMAAMRMSPGIRYDARLFSLSILIAVITSGTALWLVSRLRNHSTQIRRLRAAASLVMGLAITGMHYTGMAAARFREGSMCMASRSGVDVKVLVVLILVGTTCVLGIALLTSTFDDRLESRTARLANSLAHANDELTHLALHDPLTGLPNRAFLQRRIEELVEREGSISVSLLFIDLDGFKSINDAYGHKLGDDVLMEIAHRIRRQLRSGDLVARLGGDEFVVLSEEKESANMGRLAGRLIAAVQEPIEVASHSLRLSASIGIATDRKTPENRRDLLTHADLAMYQAKSQGGSSYCFFQPSMHAEARERLELLQDLRLALGRGEFELHYQPQFGAEDLSVVGVEALVRWRHPERGLISPDVFIPIAETTGLIVQIGAWVLDEACRQMALWRSMGRDHWTVAVNLSSLQLLDPALAYKVRSALQHHRIEPRHLVLEITETTAMRNVDVSMGILQQLSEIGVRISIDDFGTGYSSLLHLKRLPATELKIDRGFVRDLREGTEDSAIIAAIVALGKTLDMTIVAEGVETPEQQQFLTGVGCTALQGYLLGRPNPPQRLDELLASYQEDGSPWKADAAWLEPANL